MEQFDFLDNRVFDDRFSAFAPQGKQTLEGGDMFSRTEIDTGVKVLKNGDVNFGIYAPNAKEAAVVFGLKPEEPLNLQKGEDGIFRGTLPYNKLFCGPKAFQFRVDGMLTLSTYCPMYYSHGMAINYVDIPDKNTPYILMQDVPHGTVSTEFYYSDALEAYQRCLVYTPPMYHEGGEYPVLYLQHGAGENETSWVYNGRVNHIMDNMIAAGEAKPFVIVMNDGMVRGKGESFLSAGESFQKSLIESCIPFIEKKYRVKKDKWNRGIAGFSMGSMQSCMIGLSNVDVFAYIGLLSGFMRKLGGHSADINKSFEYNSHLKIFEDKERFLKEVKLFYRGIGSDDSHVEAFLTDDEICQERGFDKYPNVYRNMVEGYPHDWAILRILFHDFAGRIF